MIECEPAGDEKGKFMDKTQDELIELLICAQVRLNPSLLFPTTTLMSVHGSVY